MMTDSICISTHGGAGYAPGSYQREDGQVVCGVCGTIFIPPTKPPSWVARGVSFEQDEEERRKEYRKTPFLKILEKLLGIKND